MEIVYLIVGLIIGALLGVGGVILFKQKKQNVDLGDFKKDLENLSKQVESYHTKADTDRGSVGQILKDMRAIEQNFGKEVYGLRTVLISGGGQKQGAWGEMVLEKILETLGFTEGVEYETQKVFDNEEERKKPDVIVRLPKGRDVIIDSKVSLTAWYEYENATDQMVKEQALQKHVASLEKHIKGLAKKHYQRIKDLKSLDAVIMFTPNEQSIFSLGKDSRDLMDLAFSQKVTLVGPVMIYFVLKAIEANWQVDKQSKNLRQVKEIAEKLGSQAVVIYESAKNSRDSVEKTVKSLDKVLSQIQDGRGSFLGRIKKMIKIGGFNPEKPIPSSANESIENDHVQNIVAKEENKDE